MTEQQLPTFWVTGYLPNGVKASFTVPIGIGEHPFTSALAFTNALLESGFLLTEPGLNEGEQYYTITHIARRTQSGKDGKPPTPIIDFYADGHNFSSLKTWLNTSEQIQEFENWSGVKLANLKPFPGTAAIKRGENVDADSYVVALAVSRKVIWKHNPDYVEGSKTEAKRIFERFDTVHIPTADLSGKLGAGSPDTRRMGNTPPSQPATQGAPLMQEWGAFYKMVDPLYKGNLYHRKASIEKLVQTGEIDPKTHTKEQAYEIVKQHIATKNAQPEAG